MWRCENQLLNKEWNVEGSDTTEEEQRTKANKKIKTRSAG
jgi:hypothetical protein